jgi:hypothetical protein
MDGDVLGLPRLARAARARRAARVVAAVATTLRELWCTCGTKYFDLKPSNIMHAARPDGSEQYYLGDVGSVGSRGCTFPPPCWVRRYLPAYRLARGFVQLGESAYSVCSMWGLMLCFLILSYPHRCVQPGDAEGGPVSVTALFSYQSLMVTDPDREDRGCRLLAQLLDGVRGVPAAGVFAGLLAALRERRLPPFIAIMDALAAC